MKRVFNRKMKLEKTMILSYFKAEKCDSCNKRSALDSFNTTTLITQAALIKFKMGSSKIFFTINRAIEGLLYARLHHTSQETPQQLPPPSADPRESYDPHSTP